MLAYFCVVKNRNTSINLEASIGPWLERTVKAVDYHLQECIKEADLDLTKEQMIVLKRLHDNDGLNQNELAFLTLRDKSSLTRMLTKMERKKYIFRKQSVQDKRINHVYLTNEGRAIFMKSKPIIHHLISTMENQISEAEKEITIATLQKIQSNLTELIP